MDINIRLQDFVPQRLVCLAEALKRQYGDRKSIEIYIFSDHTAAKRVILPSELSIEGSSPEADQWTAQMHAMYLYHSDEQEEYLYIMPDPLRSSRDWTFNTRIDLPITATPKCRLELNSRCLLALPHIKDSWNDPKARPEGSVTLTATITRGGGVAALRAAELNVNPREYADLLASLALQNIKGWRFEDSQHEDAIRISFSYSQAVPKDVAPTPGMQIKLPNLVIMVNRIS